MSSAEKKKIHFFSFKFLYSSHCGLTLRNTRQFILLPLAGFGTLGNLIKRLLGRGEEDKNIQIMLGYVFFILVFNLFNNLFKMQFKNQFLFKRFRESSNDFRRRADFYAKI